MALGGADINGKFVMFTANHTGGTHDSLAWQGSSIYDGICQGKLPSDFFVIGDEAFSCTNQMLSPWPGKGSGRWKLKNLQN